MARENVMSTPIFDQLLREMAQRAEPRATPPSVSSAQPSAQSSAQPPAPPAPSAESPPGQEPEDQTPSPRRRHRAD